MYQEPNPGQASFRQANFRQWGGKGKGHPPTNTASLLSRWDFLVFRLYMNFKASWPPEARARHEGSYGGFRVGGNVFGWGGEDVGPHLCTRFSGHGPACLSETLLKVASLD